jgi:hypothetical protein
LFFAGFGEVDSAGGGDGQVVGLEVLGEDGFLAGGQVVGGDLFVAAAVKSAIGAEFEARAIGVGDLGFGAVGGELVDGRGFGAEVGEVEIALFVGGEAVGEAEFVGGEFPVGGGDEGGEGGVGEDCRRGGEKKDAGEELSEHQNIVGGNWGTGKVPVLRVGREGDAGEDFGEWKVDLDRSELNDL